MTIDQIGRQIGKHEIRALVGRKDPLVLEIGAHHGLDSLGFLHEFPGIRLECFEPDPRSIEIHRAAIRDDRCRLHACAIGARAGTTRLYQSSGHPDPESKIVWDSSSSIRAPTASLQKEFPWLLFNEATDVQVLTLDGWAAEHLSSDDVIDFIWADIQGAEIDLIEGGRTTLEARTRFIYTEFCDDEWYEGEIPLSAIIERLPGFDPIALYLDNVLLRNRSLT